MSWNDVGRKNLKALMERRGLTQREVGDAIGVDHSSITRWLKGERRPSVDQLVDLATFFRVSIDSLMGVASGPLIADADRQEILGLLKGAVSRLEDQAR